MKDHQIRALERSLRRRPRRQARYRRPLFPKTPLSYLGPWDSTSVMCALMSHYYLPSITEQFNQKKVLLSRLRRSHKPVEGKTFSIPLRTVRGPALTPPDPAS